MSVIVKETNREGYLHQEEGTASAPPDVRSSPSNSSSGNGNRETERTNASDAKIFGR
jgi:hypothetical protein